MCRGQLTFLLPSGSRPPSFSLTAILSSSRLSSSHKWLQGCSQARLPRRSLRVALARSLEKQPGSPAPCPFPPAIATISGMLLLLFLPHRLSPGQGGLPSSQSPKG